MKTDVSEADELIVVYLDNGEVIYYMNKGKGYRFAWYNELKVF